MFNSKGLIWSLALFGCTFLVLAALVGRTEAKGVHEEDNDKAIDDKHSGELADSHKMRRSVELSASNFERLFKRASGDGDGAESEEKPHKGKKRKKNGSTTTTLAPGSSSKAPAGSTTDKPAGSTTKAPSGGDKSPTTTTTGKPGSTTAAAAATTTTTTTGKPSLSPKKQDSADIIKIQEDEANILTNMENSLTSWDKWLNDNRLTLNRHFALEVYHHMRRIMLMQGLEHQKHQKPMMFSGPAQAFIRDGDQTLPLTMRGPYPKEVIKPRNRIF